MDETEDGASWRIQREDAGGEAGHGGAALRFLPQSHHGQWCVRLEKGYMDCGGERHVSPSHGPRGGGRRKRPWRRRRCA
jgi:hypothetical protein